MRVVYEPKAKDYDPGLYTADAQARYTDGWDAIDFNSLRYYLRDGYLIVKNAYNAEEVRAAQEELRMMTLADDPDCESVYYEGTIRELMEVNGGMHNDGHAKSLDGLALGFSGTELPDIAHGVRAKYVRKFMGFTATHPPLRRMAEHPKLLELMRRLCKNQEVELFQEMAMIKPPSGREKPWHQDHAYFNHPLDTPIIGVWISLSKVNPENGCMFMLPGLHHEGPIPHFMRRDWQICDKDISGLPAYRRVAAPMAPGDVLIFDSKLPHGTPKNNSDEYRWALQLHYRSVGSESCRDDDRLANFGSEGKDVSC